MARSPTANPDSAEVTAFAVAHAQRVQFHQYLQWLATRQLARAAAHCDALGMGVGLYVDLAVSVDRAGSDTWGAQASVFARRRQRWRAARRVQPRRARLGPAAAAP